MIHQQIKNHRTNAVIFEGAFLSFRHCVEHAVGHGIKLDYADLARANLVNATLDEASLRYARLCGANLMGANLSEARLDGADFTDAGLQNACLCFSSLRGCRFEGALFGATDIAGAVIDRSYFSTLSAFSLNFCEAGSMKGCFYSDPDGKTCALSQPPVVINGLRYPVIIMDRHIRIGGWLQTHTEFSAGAENGNDARAQDRDVHNFVRKRKKSLDQMLSLFQSAETEDRLRTQS